MPDLKTMTVREFLRGGYREVSSPTVVMNGGEVAGVWSPGLTGIDVTYPTVSTNGTTQTARPARAKLPDLTKRA